MMEGESFSYYINAIFFVYTIHYVNIVIYNIINLISLFFFLIDLSSKFDHRRSCKSAIIVGNGTWPILHESKANTRLYQLHF